MRFATHIRTATIFESPVQWVNTVVAIFVTGTGRRRPAATPNTTALLAVVVFSLAVPAVAAQDTSTQTGTPWTVDGDFRGRFEMDRSSRTADGLQRPDRDRFRVRGRLGVRYAIDRHVSFGMRLRTGHPDSRQSPHVTLGDGFSTLPIALDRLYASVRTEHAGFWFGKNAHPFVRDNELFWDADVTPEGVGGFARILARSKGQVDLHGGAFVLEPPNNSTVSDISGMFALQSTLSLRGAMSGLIATGLEIIRQNPHADDELLGDLDYSIVTATARIEHAVGRVPVTAAFNLENYEKSVFNRDEREALVLGLQIGPGDDMRGIALRYTWARVEELAVVARFAQDDWLRWGSATMTRASNFEGHEFRLRIDIASNQNLVARFYRVEGIRPRSPAATALESGTRFRIDWNISF